MNTRQKRSQNFSRERSEVLELRTRVFRDANTVLPLIEWLNRSEDHEGHARIVHLIRTIQAMEELLDTPHFQDQAWLEDLTHPQALHLLALHEDVTDRLSQYVFIAQLRVPRLSVERTANPWSIRWTAAPDTTQAFHDSHNVTRGLLCGTESDAARRLLLLSEANGVQKISRCVCGTWIFQKFTSQDFCSAKCRVKNHKTQPRYKEKAALSAKISYYRDRVSDPIKGAKYAQKLAEARQALETIHASNER